ncbi:MAG: hypothetical protein QF893_18840 [Alphaproteobacteria bacterium]|nr:hypothetical protein [Alphaproteobacteria bacterium]
MSKGTFLAAALATVIATPALAGHCPADVKAIDHALSKMSIPAAKMTEVKALRDEGDALHKAGKKKQSTDVLAMAMLRLF